MLKEKVTIDFKMNIPSTDLNINLSAQAELHHSQPYWLLRTVRIIPPTGIERGMPVFKNISIRKIEKNGEVYWVHCDTNLESPLSAGAGEAIDALAK